ncbi:unnamed protein product [Blepharisma stoltei]|uniref:Membrane insertase YidC/Oxa/ALB C-terminal domain-containing protein n=1 Tax=Blepharisma stoltei TaxID=1481888 RepID=A0AAU9K2J4_9CILI|nr:unnamed protein product [Blepharisma stoltei]
MIRTLARRRFSDLPNFIPTSAEAISRLPPFLEFYRPVIEATQHIIENIQLFTGCPWWISIGILTLLVRSSMIPFLFLQMKSMSPLARAWPDHRFNYELTNDAKMNKIKKFFTFLKSSNQINKHHGVKVVRAGLYGFLQVPHFLTYIWSVRMLCVNNKSLETGGALWFQNLNEPDPYMILPFVSLTLTYLNLQRGITPQTKDWIINRIRGLIQISTILTLPVAVHWPAGVFCYWGVSAGFSLAQSYLLTHPAFIKKYNPNYEEDMKNLGKASQAFDPEEGERMVNHICTGEESYASISEKEALIDIDKYLKEQKKMVKEMQNKS